MAQLPDPHLPMSLLRTAGAPELERPPSIGGWILKAFTAYATSVVVIYTLMALLDLIGFSSRGVKETGLNLTLAALFSVPNFLFSRVSPKKVGHLIAVGLLYMAILPQLWGLELDRRRYAPHAPPVDIATLTTFVLPISIALGCYFGFPPLWKWLRERSWSGA